MTAVADYGYTFSGWSDGYTGATRADLVTGNKTLEAYFKINTYTLTLMKSRDGISSEKNQQILTKREIGNTIEAIAETG